MDAHPGLPLDPTLLADRHWVADIVYFPIETALLSLARNQAPKKGVAMTGELTLTGQVLPIGGVREKVIAARRQKIFELILPEANRGSYEELPDYLKEGLTVHFAKRYGDVAKVLFD